MRARTGIPGISNDRRTSTKTPNRQFPAKRYIDLEKSCQNRSPIDSKDGLTSLTVKRQSVNPSEVVSRLYDKDVLSKKARLREQRKKEQELQECTFKPKI